MLTDDAFHFIADKAVIVAEPGSVSSPYDPLEDRAVHRNFADIPPDAEDVAIFALAHGFLLTEFAEDRRIVEPAALWFPRIDWLHHLISSWDNTADGEGEHMGGTGELYRWEDGRLYVREATVPEGPHTPEGWRGRPAWWDAGAFTLDDPFAPGLVRYICTRINEELSPVFRPHLEVNAWERRPRVRVTINRLWDAVLYSFVREMVEGGTFRRCAVCRKWLREYQSMGAEERTACSPACRQRLYRQRKAEAIRLKKEGHSVKDIAQQLNTDPATVQKWVK